MDIAAGPLQDFELRVFRAERPGPAEPALSPEHFSAAIAQAQSTAIDSGPGHYKAEVVTGDGRRAVIELGALPKDELQTLRDPRLYGTRLFHWLLRPALIKELREDADVVEGSPPGLFGSDPQRTRLRLTLDLRDPELHSIWWEYLWDPSAALADQYTDVVFPVRPGSQRSGMAGAAATTPHGNGPLESGGPPGVRLVAVRRDVSQASGGKRRAPGGSAG